MTMVSTDDIRTGKWQFNPALAGGVNLSPEQGQRHLAHYTAQLEAREKYALTIWPYHAMLGGIGHALVSSIEEALFFHNIARYSTTDFIIKGENPLTEAYSAIGPEIIEGHQDQPLATRSDKLLQKVISNDAVIITGQAKSHCVAWTVTDLLNDIQAVDPALAKKVYLLEDCTSPVVVPGVVDFTDTANKAYKRFANAGMHVIKSTDRIMDRLEIGS
jgi:nicotinamidase-related amidase